MKKKTVYLIINFLCGLGLSACENKAETEAQSDVVIELPISDVNSNNTSGGLAFEDDQNINDDKNPVVDTDKKIDEANKETDGTIEENNKKDFLVSIDPGHQSPEIDMSGKEPNAPGSSTMKTKATGGTVGRYSGIPEYQLNLDISLMLRDKLEAQGYDVIMTRENNKTAISNAERAELANDAGADIAVRIHANGSESTSANGALVLIGSAENPYVGSLYEESQSLAEKVLNAYCSSTGMKNLGVQTNDTMTGINWSKIPVIILEMGFMTNEQDDMNMADDGYREKMADGIVNGINAYYESLQ